jgi:hypothetical protein
MEALKSEQAAYGCANQTYQEGIGPRLLGQRSRANKGAVADGLDRFWRASSAASLARFRTLLLGIVLQMVALELDELIKAVLAQRDALSRVLPPCPGQILPIVSACTMQYWFVC